MARSSVQVTYKPTDEARIPDALTEGTSLAQSQRSLCQWGDEAVRSAADLLASSMGGLRCIDHAATTANAAKISVLMRKNVPWEMLVTKRTTNMPMLFPRACAIAGAQSERARRRSHVMRTPAETVQATATNKPKKVSSGLLCPRI